MSMKVGGKNECHNGCGDYICTVIGKYLRWNCPRCHSGLYTDLNGKEPDDMSAVLKDIETLKEV